MTIRLLGDCTLVPNIDAVSIFLHPFLFQWAKSPKEKQSEGVRIHSYRLLFRRFCPLGNYFSLFCIFQVMDDLQVDNVYMGEYSFVGNTLHIAPNSNAA